MQFYYANYTAYDKVGNLKSINELAPWGSATTNYGYDKLYQLLSETRTGASPYTHSYAYDPWGNRVTADGATSLYDDGNRLMSTPAGTYAYDDNGNLTGKVINGLQTSYVYDLDGNLTSVALPGNRQIGFKYDSDGTRIARSENSAISTKYVYAGDGLVQELDASGITKTLYNPGISQTT